MEFTVAVVCYRRLGQSVRPPWLVQLVLFLALVGGGAEGRPSVGVFRLGVLRYNHMTLGKTTVVEIRWAKWGGGGAVVFPH